MAKLALSLEERQRRLLDRNRKISASRKGKPFTLQHRRNISLGKGGDGKVAPVEHSHPRYDAQRRLWKKFKITPDDYNAMLERQSGRCGICGTESPGARYEAFSVDHNHTTGKVRGLLCSKCNLGLGLLEEVLDEAVKWVE